MKRGRPLPIYAWLGLVSILLSACASLAFPKSAPGATATPAAADNPFATADPSRTSQEGNLIPPEEVGDPFEGQPVRFNARYWPDTDFSKHSVDYDQITSGGPPPDGIPAIDAPDFETVFEAAQWLGDDWPVLFFEWHGDPRAYPLAILIWHEIVNDVVGGEPVTLTFCPLCNATIAFRRTLPDGRILDFGTTGNLRNSDLVMYDRQTRSWWQQFTGEAIVGELTGTTLEFLPSQIVSFRDFARAHPGAKVLSRNTGYDRLYGHNPYSGYDSINGSPFLLRETSDGRLPPMERVVAINIQGIDVAYPFSSLESIRAVNDAVSGESIVVFWKPGTTSTFGNSIKDTGSTAVFSRVVEGRILSFRASDSGFQDVETGSSWDIFGQASEGVLAGRRLKQVISAEHFWFAWAVFRPDTIIWSP